MDREKVFSKGERNTVILNKELYKMVKSLLKKSGFDVWLRKEFKYNKHNLNINDMIRLGTRGKSEDSYLGLSIDTREIHKTVYNVKEFEEFADRFILFINLLKDELPIELITPSMDHIERYLNACSESVKLLLPHYPNMFIFYDDSNFITHLEPGLTFDFQVIVLGIQAARSKLGSGKLFIGDTHTKEKIKDLFNEVELLKEIQNQLLTGMFQEEKRKYDMKEFRTIKLLKEKCKEKQIKFKKCLVQLSDLTAIRTDEIILNVEEAVYKKKIDEDSTIKLSFFKIRDVYFMFSNEKEPDKVIYSRTKKEFVNEFLQEFTPSQ